MFYSDFPKPNLHFVPQKQLFGFSLHFSKFKFSKFVLFVITVLRVIFVWACVCVFMCELAHIIHDFGANDMRKWNIKNKCSEKKN